MSEITQLGAEAEAEAKEQTQAELEQVESTEVAEDATAVEQPAENVRAGDPESVVKRINKYAARAKSAEELYLQEQNKNLLMQQQFQQFLAVAQKQQGPQDDPHAPIAPNKAQFADRPLDYAEALANYWMQKNQYDAMQQQKQYQVMQSEKTQRQIEAQYAQKVRIAKETYEDWDDAFESLQIAANQVPQHKINEITFNIQALTNGPDITRYLGLHPDEFVALGNADSRVAAIRLAEIGAKLKPPAKKLVTSAPPPRQIKGEVVRKAPKDETIDELAKRLARNR